MRHTASQTDPSPAVFSVLLLLTGGIAALMFAQKRAREMLLIGTLLFTGCAPIAYQQSLAEGERPSQMQEQYRQLEQRVTDLEQQMAGRQVSALAPTPAPQPTSQTWRQRFDSIPRGSTYAAVEQAVGQPTYTEAEGDREVYLYYISDQEIYLLFFESGVYRQGIVTDTNWMKWVRSGHRF